MIPDATGASSSSEPPLWQPQAGTAATTVSPAGTATIAFRGIIICHPPSPHPSVPPPGNPRGESGRLIALLRRPVLISHRDILQIGLFRGLIITTYGVLYPSSFRVRGLQKFQNFKFPTAGNFQLSLLFYIKITSEAASAWKFQIEGKMSCPCKSV